MLLEEFVVDIDDDFIGSEIITPKGSVLKIVGHNGLTKNKKRYYYTCSECDKNPIYNKHFNSHKFNLTTNFRYSCGCYRAYSLTEEEQVRRLDLICHERNLTFIGFVGEYNGNNTYLKLMCNKHKYCWNTTILSSFINTDLCGCQLCVFEKIQKEKNKDNDRFISEFLSTGVFLDGTMFYRSDRIDTQGKRNYWYYICPVCSFDSYVEAGLCSGKFESHVGNLRVGKLACRCSKRFCYSSDQKMHRVKLIIEKENHTFLELITSAERQKDKVKWQCGDCGHNNEFLYNSIIVANTCNCSNCGSKGGYTVTKPGTLYLIRWYGFGEEYLKFGITNKSVESRVYKQSIYSKLDHNILYKFHYEDGNHPDKLEKLIKSSVQTNICRKDWMEDGYTETTYMENLNKILKIVENYNKTISV